MEKSLRKSDASFWPSRECTCRNTHTQQINYKREERRREGEEGKKGGREERRGKEKENVLNLTKKKKMVKTLKKLSQINCFIQFEYSLHTT